MMCMASVTSRCSRAGAEALRQGAQLAADAKDTIRSGAVLLRGSPFALGWVAGWVSTEFPLHVLTGHALSRVSPRRSVGSAPPGRRSERTWRSPRLSRNLLVRTSVTWYRTRAGILPRSPGEAACCRRGLAAATRPRPPTFPTVLVAGRICSTSGGVPTWRRGAVRRC